MPSCILRPARKRTGTCRPQVWRRRRSRIAPSRYWPLRDGGYGLRLAKHLFSVGRTEPTRITRPDQQIKRGCSLPDPSVPCRSKAPVLRDQIQQRADAVPRACAPGLCQTTGIHHQQSAVRSRGRYWQNQGRCSGRRPLAIRNAHYGLGSAMHAEHSRVPGANADGSALRGCPPTGNRVVAAFHGCRNYVSSLFQRERLQPHHASGIGLAGFSARSPRSARTESSGFCAPIPAT